MHEVLTAIVSELNKTSTALTANVPSDEPFGIAHGNWSFPSITRTELIEHVATLVTKIQERAGNTLGNHETKIRDYIRRLQFLQTHTVPNMWTNAGLGVPAFLHTIEGLEEALRPIFKAAPEMAQEAFKDVLKVRSRAAAMESRLNDLEPRSTMLTSMLDRIESAYSAADQLPADLEQLAHDRDRMKALLNLAEGDYLSVLNNKNQAIEAHETLKDSAEEAKKLLEQCHSAYAAATSQGLAAAFTERSKALDRSMWFWVGSFVVALGTGAHFGSQRLHELTDLMKSPNLTIGTASLNFALAIISVGAPIWFGWLASKQIGQRFRLSEDYAFKAAVSRAYEGYRREAARFDKDMEARLLSSALNRLDEQPLRFVEPNSHGSPWHELASSELVKSAMQSIPGFAEKVTNAAKDALGTIKLGNSNEETSGKKLSNAEKEEAKQ